MPTRIEFLGLAVGAILAAGCGGPAAVRVPVAGTVTHDLATHVSYEYDLDRRELVHCEVSGYLARYAPTGDVVNLSQGGGVIPVLVEEDAP